MRKRRIAVLFTACLVPLATPAVAAETQFTPKTLTMQTLAMTGQPPKAAAFTPKTLTMQTLAMTGLPPVAVPFTPKTLTMQTLGMTGIGVQP